MHEVLKSGLHQARLHLVGSQGGILLEQESSSSADYGCGHAGPAQDKVGAGRGAGAISLVQRSANLTAWILLIQSLRCSVQGDDEVARCDKIGFHHLVDECGPLGTVTRGYNAGGIRHTLGIHRADGDDIWVVAWSCDSAITIVLRVVVATIVTARNHNNNPCLPSLFHRLAQWVECVAFPYRSSHRKVYDLDIVSALQSDGRLDSRNHLAIGSLAILVEDSKVDQIHVGGNALESVEVVPSCGILASSSEYASDMSAVAVRVGGNCVGESGAGEGV